MSKRFFHSVKAKRLFVSLLALCTLLCALLAFCGCKEAPILTDYVSEHRNNLFLYEGDDFFIKAQNVEREHPYVADGYKGEMTHRAELFITAPVGTQSCSLFLIADGIEHRGEASYDNVKKHFYYSCAADLSNTETLPLRIGFDGAEQEITLTSVKTKDLLSANELLARLFEAEAEQLKPLVHGREFCGELYIRLLYENAPYFYVGVVDRSGNTTAFLMDGKTGKILAKRNA